MTPPVSVEGMTSLNILLVEPYFGGSHAAWATGYQQHSKHKVTLLTLPAQFWKWRMQGGAVTLARLFEERACQPDLIVASDMLDLTIFRALTGVDVPCVLYFHENQLTYPQNTRQNHGWQYGFINYVSALAADFCLFNSGFHRDTFFDTLPRMLKHFADYNELDSIRALRQHCDVLPLGLGLQRLDTCRPQGAVRNQEPLIMWNHRWEEDKNPRLFLDTLCQLKDDGLSFKVVLAGENTRQRTPEFETACRYLGPRIVQHYGYIEHFADYARWLWQADYAVSTAYQDFFGIAVAEAMYCECVPLLPHRLNYPALIPESQQAACLYDNDGLYALLKQHLSVDAPVADTAALRASISRYDWAQMAAVYDAVFIRLAAGLPPFPDS